MTASEINDVDDLRGMLDTEILAVIHRLRDENKRLDELWLRYGLALRHVLDLAALRAHKKIDRYVRDILGDSDDLALLPIEQERDAAEQRRRLPRPARMRCGRQSQHSRSTTTTGRRVSQVIRRPTPRRMPGSTSGISGTRRCAPSCARRKGASVTPERLAEIKARCEKASDGPWTPNYSGEVDGPAYVGTVTVSGFRRYHDAAFVSHARQDVPDLLAALAALQQRVERLEGALRAANGIIHEGMHGGKATDPEHQERCERPACKRIRAALADAGTGVVGDMPACCKSWVYDPVTHGEWDMTGHHPACDGEQS